MGYISGTKVLPAFKRDARELIPTIESADNFWRASDYNSVRSAMQELLDFARSGGGGVTYPLTLTEPVGSSPTTAFRIIDNIGLETFSIKADGSFIVSDKFQFGLGEYEPALELLQSTHVYTGNRFTSFDYNWPEYAGGTPAHGLVFITSNSPIQPRQYFPVRSTDGSTWTKGAALGFSPHTIVTSGNTLFTLGSSLDILSLYRSDDGGSTWTLVSEPPSSFYRLRSLADGTLVGSGYSGGAPAIWYSVDEGSSWLELLPPMDSLSSIQRIQNRWILAVSTGGYPTILYSDDGENWESGSLSAPTQGLNSFDTAMLVVAPGIDDNLILIMELVFNTGSCETRIFRSSDLGVTWVGEGAALGDVRLVNDHTAFITSTRYLCVAVWFYELNIGGYVAISTAPVDAGPIQLTTVPIRVDPVNTTGPVSEIHETIEFNGRIYGFGHTRWSGGALARVVWSDDLTGANWLNLSDPITKLAPQAGYLDLGAKYLELTEPLTGAKYFSVEMDEATNTVLTAVGDIRFQVPDTSLTITRGAQTHLHDRVVWISDDEFAATFGFYSNGRIVAIDSSGTGANLAYSEDEGQTWTRVRNFIGDSTYTILSAIAMGPSGVGAMFGNGGAYQLAVSEDGGGTWTEYPADPLAPGFLLAFGGDVLLNSDGGGVVVSDDRGATWRSIDPQPLPNGVYYLLATATARIVASNTEGEMAYVDSAPASAWSTTVNLRPHLPDGGTGQILRTSIIAPDGTIHFLFSDGVSKEYDVIYSADATTFVGVEAIPFTRLSNNDHLSGTDGTKILLSGGSSSWNRVLDVLNGTSSFLTTEAGDVEIHSTVWTGATWVAIGHKRSDPRRALALYSLDGILWGTELPAVVLNPEGGVLELYTNKLSICEPTLIGPVDRALVNIYASQNSLSLTPGVGDDFDFTLRAPNRELAIGHVDDHFRLGRIDRVSGSCFVICNGPLVPHTSNSPGSRITSSVVTKLGQHKDVTEVENTLVYEAYGTDEEALFYSLNFPTTGENLLSASSRPSSFPSLVTDPDLYPSSRIAFAPKVDLRNAEPVPDAAILLSPINGSFKQLPADGSVSAITAFSGQYFVAKDTAVYAVNPANQTWSLSYDFTPTVINGLASSVDRLVAVGEGGLIAVLDRVSEAWTIAASGTPENLYAVAYLPFDYTPPGHPEQHTVWNRFSAVGAQETLVVSDDGGETWATVALGVSGSNFLSVSGVAYQHRLFWAIGGTEGICYTGMCVPTPDLKFIDWTPAGTAPTSAITGLAFDLAYPHPLVGVGDDGWAGRCYPSLENTPPAPVFSSLPVKGTVQGLQAVRWVTGSTILIVGNLGFVALFDVYTDQETRLSDRSKTLEDFRCIYTSSWPNTLYLGGGTGLWEGLYAPALTIQANESTPLRIEASTTFYRDATFSNGAILTSPNGTLYRISVDNDGVLTSTPV